MNKIQLHQWTKSQWTKYNYTNEPSQDEQHTIIQMNKITHWTKYRYTNEQNNDEQNTTTPMNKITMNKIQVHQ